MKTRFGAIATTLATSTAVMLSGTANVAIVTEPITHYAPDSAFTCITAIDTHNTGQFNQSAAEIVAYPAQTKRLI